jgi:hypothetical protein
MIFTLSVALGLPLLLSLGFTVLLFLARRPNPKMMRITIPEEETYYRDLDHPNSIFRL